MKGSGIIQSRGKYAQPCQSFSPLHDIGVSDQVKLPLMDDVLLGLILLNDRVEVKALDFLTVSPESEVFHR